MYLLIHCKTGVFLIYSKLSPRKQSHMLAYVISIYHKLVRTISYFLYKLLVFYSCHYHVLHLINLQPRQLPVCVLPVET
jgi:ABC-type arginine transport system permease subunit